MLDRHVETASQLQCSPFFAVSNDKFFISGLLGCCYKLQSSSLPLPSLEYWVPYFPVHFLASSAFVEYSTADHISARIFLQHSTTCFADFSGAVSTGDAVSCALVPGLGRAVSFLARSLLGWVSTVFFSAIMAWLWTAQIHFPSLLAAVYVNRMPSFIVYVLQQHASRPSALSLVLQDSFLVSRNFFPYNGLFCLQLLLVAAERAFRWNLSHLLCFFPHIFSDERILFG